MLGREALPGIADTIWCVILNTIWSAAATPPLWLSADQLVRRMFVSNRQLRKEPKRQRCPRTPNLHTAGNHLDGSLVSEFGRNLERT